MIIEKTGAIAEYYNTITNELFDGYLGGEAKTLRLEMPIDASLICISNALSQIKSFFREMDFDFSDEDGDIVIKSVRERKYLTCRKNMPYKKIVDTYTALSSNEKISYITVTVIYGEILKISVLYHDLNESLTWEESDQHRKDVMFNDLFTRRTTSQN